MVFLSNLNRFIAASLSCLQHDVKTASCCLKYHLFTDFNPFSVACREDLKPICDALDSFYKHLEDPEFQQSVSKRF